MRRVSRPAKRLTFTFRSIVVLMMGLAGFAGAVPSDEAPAIGPVIQQIPDVIIGDMGDVENGDGEALHLLRYVNVVNLDDITNEPNSGDPSKLVFWYEVANATLRVSNSTALIEPLTAEESAQLRASQAVKPPLSKSITQGTDFWLSLIEDAPGPGKSHAASAASASAAENGNTAAGLSAADATGGKTVVLYVIDDVLTSQSLWKMQFDV